MGSPENSFMGKGEISRAPCRPKIDHTEWMASGCGRFFNLYWLCVYVCVIFHLFCCCSLVAGRFFFFIFGVFIGHNPKKKKTKAIKALNHNSNVLKFRLVTSGAIFRSHFFYFSRPRTNFRDRISFFRSHSILLSFSHRLHVINPK